ncbi:MAG TPA: hypothetical protein VFM48_07730 [Aquabacterium sp.]|nr:hypothetical protein [Aquabacterium sp.]
MNRTMIILTATDDDQLHIESLSDQPTEMTLPNAVAGVIGAQLLQLVDQAQRAIAATQDPKATPVAEAVEELAKPTLRLLDSSGKILEE